MINANEIEVIAPNFKKRHSGVTSTVLRLVPLQARDIGIVASGPDLPPDVPNISPGKLLFLPGRASGAPRVWHARRNNEMLAGLAFKYIARKKLKLLFTSAAQRKHTYFTRWMIRKMDAIIATSSKSASFLERESKVINHGIDCTVFTPSEDRKALRRKLELPETGPLIGCFGRIRHQKGNDLFIDAVIKAFDRKAPGTALVMGRATDDNADYLADLKSKVAGAGYGDRVVFRDEVPMEQLADHFRALDLYVAPQRWEGFGLTPLEAMACGAPVVATRVGAFEDLILDQKTGYLVDIEDVAAIADRLEKLLTDDELREQMGRAARHRATQEFTLQKEADAIIQVYRQLLAE